MSRLLLETETEQEGKVDSYGKCMIGGTGLQCRVVTHDTRVRVSQSHSHIVSTIVNPNTANKVKPGQTAMGAIDK